MVGLLMKDVQRKSNILCNCQVRQQARLLKHKPYSTLAPQRRHRCIGVKGYRSLESITGRIGKYSAQQSKKRGFPTTGTAKNSRDSIVLYHEIEVFQYTLNLGISKRQIRYGDVHAEDGT